MFQPYSDKIPTAHSPFSSQCPNKGSTWKALEIVRDQIYSRATGPGIVIAFPTPRQCGVLKTCLFASVLPNSEVTLSVSRISSCQADRPNESRTGSLIACGGQKLPLSKEGLSGNMCSWLVRLALCETTMT